MFAVTEVEFASSCQVARGAVPPGYLARYVTYSLLVIIVRLTLAHPPPKLSDVFPTHCTGSATGHPQLR